MTLTSTTNSTISISRTKTEMLWVRTKIDWCSKPEAALNAASSSPPGTVPHTICSFSFAT